MTAAADYRLDVARDAAFSSYVAGYSQLGLGATTSYVVDGLSEGVYYYRVSARDADGTQGRASGSVSVIVPVLAEVVDWRAY